MSSDIWGYAHTRFYGVLRLKKKGVEEEKAVTSNYYDPNTVPGLLSSYVPRYRAERYVVKSASVRSTLSGQTVWHQDNTSPPRFNWDNFPLCCNCGASDDILLGTPVFAHGTYCALAMMEAFHTIHESTDDPHREVLPREKSLYLGLLAWLNAKTSPDGKTILDGNTIRRMQTVPLILAAHQARRYRDAYDSFKNYKPPKHGT